MVRIGNFKKLDVISPDGNITSWGGDDIEITTIFLSVSENGDTVSLIINPDESEFEEEIV